MKYNPNNTTNKAENNPSNGGNDDAIVTALGRINESLKKLRENQGVICETIIHGKVDVSPLVNALKTKQGDNALEVLSHNITNFEAFAEKADILGLKDKLETTCDKITTAEKNIDTHARSIRNMPSPKAHIDEKDLKLIGWIGWRAIMVFTTIVIILSLVCGASIYFFAEGRKMRIEKEQYETALQEHNILKTYEGFAEWMKKTHPKQYSIFVKQYNKSLQKENKKK